MAIFSLRYTKDMPDKKPMSDDERQEFVDNLPDDEKRDDAEQLFDDTIARAAQPPQSIPEIPESSDDYSDTQTHSDTTEDTSRSRSDTSHQ